MHKKLMKQMIFLSKTELESSISNAAALQEHMEKIFARNLEYAGLSECKKAFDVWAVVAKKSSSGFQAAVNEGFDKIGNLLNV